MTWDVIVVGAGAAGLATAIFTRTRRPESSVLLLDGARKPGAKILVSGGGRCNVTNTVVTERDYWGGPPAIVRRVLRALPVADTVSFFADAGVDLHEEHDGKLFPDSNSARQVLDALLAQAAASGVELRSSHRVLDVERDRRRLSRRHERGRPARRVASSSRPAGCRCRRAAATAPATRWRARSATPSSQPRRRSRRSCCRRVATDAPATHATWSGVSQQAILTLWVDGSVATRLRGSMLWTHFGVSGPAALDLSRHWLRARLEGRAAEATANLRRISTSNRWKTSGSIRHAHRPRAMLATILATLIPAAVAEGVARGARHRRVDNARLAHARRAAACLPRTDGMAAFPSSIREATTSPKPRRAASTCTRSIRQRWSRGSVPGLYLVGEMLDVDGRLGGFNFQWAWSSAAVAARGLSAPPEPPAEPGVSGVEHPLGQPVQFGGQAERPGRRHGGGAYRCGETQPAGRARPDRRA